MRERTGEQEAARVAQLRTLLRDGRRATEPKVLSERCAQVGVPFEPDPGPRRGGGSKQTDLARVLGMSAEHYARLERGDLPHVHPWTLDLLAHALAMDDVHHRLLFDLVNGHPAISTGQASVTQLASAQARLEVLDPVPAALLDCGWNTLAINEGFRRWFGPADQTPEYARNFVYFAFTELAETARTYVNLEADRRELIGRVLAGWPRHGHCAAFKSLIARLRSNPIAARMLAEGEAREPVSALMRTFRVLPAADPVRVAALSLELPGNLRLIQLKPEIQRAELV